MSAVHAAAASVVKGARASSSGTGAATTQLARTPGLARYILRLAGHAVDWRSALSLNPERALRIALSCQNLGRAQEALARIENGTRLTSILQSCFDEACYTGNEDAVRFLARMEVVDVAAYKNWALRIAASRGFLPIVRFLAHLDAVDVAALNNCALRHAAYRGHLPVVAFLAKLKVVDLTACGEEALRWARAYGHEHIVDFLSGLTNEMTK